MSYTIGKDRIKALSRLVDDLTNTGVIDPFDGPVWSLVITQLDKHGADHIPENQRDDLEDILDAVIAKDWDVLTQESRELFIEVIGELAGLAFDRIVEAIQKR